MPKETDGLIVPQWTFGDRLRKARAVVGLDQRGFSKRLGVTSSSIAAWETNRSIPRDSVAIARRVETVTRVPANWLLGLE